MTLDELIALYHTDFIPTVENGAVHEDARRKGMTAVVRSLRDYIEDAYSDAGNSWEGELTLKICNEILEGTPPSLHAECVPDEDGKVADGLDREAGRNGGNRENRPTLLRASATDLIPCDQNQSSELSFENSELRTENDRLRAALEGIADHIRDATKMVAEPRECAWHTKEEFGIPWIWRSCDGAKLMSKPEYMTALHTCATCGGKIKIEEVIQ